jgi:hypothetical protein
MMMIKADRCKENSGGVPVGLSEDSAGAGRKRRSSRYRRRYVGTWLIVSNDRSNGRDKGAARLMLVEPLCQKVVVMPALDTVVTHVSRSLTDRLIRTEGLDGTDECREGEETIIPLLLPLSVQLSMSMW